MQRNRRFLFLAVLALVLPADGRLSAQEQGFDEGKIVVANRASGDLSIIDVATDQVQKVGLPANGTQPEPMYVVYSAGRVLVGDRANNRVVALDPRTFRVVGMAPTAAGVWHMGADPLGTQLWVVCDVDKVATVIHPVTLQVIRRVPMPADLIAQGGRPHDVIIDPFRLYAYVSMLGVTGASDFVVKFSMTTFEEVSRAAVGKDPHLSLTALNNLLYVPCQNGNAVWVLNRENMAEVTRILVPGAHGAGMAYDGGFFYTTNFPGSGPDGLFTIDTRTNRLLEPERNMPAGLATPFAAPHNIALTLSGRKLYLTHSGPAAEKVSIYTIRPQTGTPVLAGSVTVGRNPFGLAFVP
jgi:DNA-binding beta-propeller fold protein YncE